MLLVSKETILVVVVNFKRRGFIKYLDEKWIQIYMSWRMFNYLVIWLTHIKMEACQIKLKLKQFPLFILKGEEEVNPHPTRPPQRVPEIQRLFL